MCPKHANNTCIIKLFYRNDISNLYILKSEYQHTHFRIGGYLMAEKEARNFALRDAKGNEEGVFTGRSPRGGESIIGWNLDLPRVVASLHANLSESNPRMESIMIASKRQLPKHQPIIASRPTDEISYKKDSPGKKCILSTM